MTNQSHRGLTPNHFQRHAEPIHGRDSNDRRGIRLPATQDEGSETRTKFNDFGDFFGFPV